MVDVLFIRQAHYNQIVYTNRPDDGYFAQFNTSSR